MKFASSLLILVILVCTWPARGSESLGSIEFTELLIRPQFLIQEPQEGEFDLDETSATLDWVLDKNISSRIRFGRQDLVNPPVHYGDVDEIKFGFFEAYGEFRNPYGRLRFGLLPLNYGIEGGRSESQLVFSRSLLFRNRILGLRDYGISWHVSHNGYFSEFVVHNGEADDNSDGRVWYTAHWGWTNQNRLRLGVAAQTGTTKPDSTSESTSTLGGFDKNRESKMRIGGPFVEWFPHNWRLLLEFNFGELQQEDKKDVSFVAGHFDTSYEAKENWGFHLRYDHLDPNQKQSGDLEREVTLGLSYRLPNHTSVFYLLATKVIEEQDEIANDVLRLVWKLTPTLPE